MKQRIIQILEKNGIDIAFCPNLADDLDFAFQMYGSVPATSPAGEGMKSKTPNTLNHQLSDAETVIKDQSKKIDELQNQLKKQYNAIDPKLISVDDAKQLIFHTPLFDKGVKCYCCNQFVKRYKRSINGSMASELLMLYKKTKQQPEKQYFHAVDDLHRQANASGIDKLKHWGLVIEGEGKNTETGGKHSGMWAITPQGIAFAEGRLKVPKYIKIYDRSAYGDPEGPSISINDCLSKRFKYNELMSA